VGELVLKVAFHARLVEAANEGPLNAEPNVPGVLRITVLRVCRLYDFVAVIAC
jgi:hypothetical protein